MALWIYLVVTSVLAAISIRAFKVWQYGQIAKRNGCASPRQYPHLDPIFGFDAFLQAGKMFSNNTFFPVTLARYRNLGPTFEMKTLGVPTICTIAPANVQAIFASQALNWGVEYRLPALEPYCGKGFLTTTGKEWEHSRALFSNSFRRANVKDHTTYERYIKLLFSNLPRDGSTVDLQLLVFALYLDTATLWLFGESFNSLSNGLSHEAKEFTESFANSLGGGGLRMALGPMIFLHRDKSWHESNKKNQAFVERYVDRALSRKREGKLGDDSSKRPVLLDLMAEETDDRVQLRNEALHAFIAAHETTACLISNVIFLLARHPEVFKKLHKEVLALGVADLDYDTCTRMKYLPDVINETLRLYPVFPYHQRLAKFDCILPTGGGPDGKQPIYVQAGSLAETNFAALHRVPEVWGEDAESFRPERWANVKPKAYEFMPFGGGPRSCVGKQKALMETSYFVTRLLRDFKGIEPRDEQDWTGQVQVTAKSFRGCKVALIPAIDETT